MPFRASPLIVLLGAVLATPGYSQDAPLGANIEALLEYAREHNPDLASMRFDAEAAQARITPAAALPDPVLSAEFQDITRMGEQSPTLLPSRVGSTRYALMQELPWPGKRGLKREAAESLSDAANWRVSGSWREQRSRIKSTFAQLYFLQDIERLTQEILGTTNRLEQISSARYAAGLVPQQDVIRAQLEQTALREMLVVLDGERQQLQGRMNALLGRAIDAPLLPPQHIWSLPPHEDQIFSDLRARVRKNNPLLQAETSQISAAEKNRDLAYRNRFPDFNVGIAPIQYGNAIREWELMVEFNIPLQQGSRRALERESEAMLSAAQTRRDAITNQILASLQENVIALESDRRSLTLIKSNRIPQSELSFHSALVGYENGKLDFATLLEAQTQLRQARLAQIQTEMDTRIRLAEIERIAGDE